MRQRLSNGQPATTILLILLAAAPAACGGGGGSAVVDLAPAGDSIGAQPAAGGMGRFGLPSPDRILRGVSYVPEDRVRIGSFLDPGLPRRNVEADGENARFSPSWAAPDNLDNSNLAYAVYPFSLDGYSDEPQIGIGWETAPASPNDIYVGMGAIGENVWHWFQPDTAGTVALGSTAPYLGSGGEALVAVLLTGSGESMLDWVRFGANLAPLAVFTADHTAGFAPLTVEFDSTLSRDLDGSIAIVKYDLDANGFFEDTGNELGTKEHTFDEAGTYDTILQLIDDQGGVTSEILPIVVNDPGNQSPQAVLDATPRSGPPGTQVSFDATLSVDPDGSITLVQWDWEGDGVFDEDTGTTLTNEHTYNLAGDYQATVRVFDDLNVSDTDSVGIAIGDNPNEPPTAIIAGGPERGTTGMTVLFDASSSSDSDGSITDYEWDWEGDGSYDHSTETASTSHIYNGSGDFQATVRVTDDRGATDTDWMRVRIYDESEDNDELTQADALPAIGFGNWYGNAGLDGYDGDRDDYYSFVVDSVGWITFFMYHIDDEADLDMKLLEDNGDGTTTELASATSVTDNEVIEYEFSETGTYYWYVYVWGSAPADDVADYRLEAGYGRAPDAALTATPDEGDAPLTVTLDASGSTDDGTIVQFEWDYEGDGTYDQTTGSAQPSIGHIYTVGGVYYPTVRVTDNDGLTDTATDTVTVNGDPPVASFTATPSSGARVLEVDFDASASTGVIVEYAWDFDGDGRDDLTNSGSPDSDQATAYYYSTGSFTVTLTVTDNQDRTDSTSRTVNVSGDPDSESEPNNDDDPDNTDQDAAAADQFPAFPFSNYYAHVGPKAEDGGDPGDPDDWFKFTVGDSGEVDLYMELFDHVCDIDMALYEQGDYDTSLGSSVDVDDDEQITISIDPGTYYLRVYAFTGRPAAGGYRLSGSFLPTP